jgi:hypothetical protein
VDRVIYFDPDIQLYSSGQPLLQRLHDSAEVVLTPHLTAPLADDRHPSDLAIVQSGTYNLGFLALRGTRRRRRTAAAGGNASCNATAWSTSRAACSPTRSGWTWCPGCTNTHVERHPGWNVAYWNLAHRHVQGHAETGYTVNGQPLFFFHFSGYDPRSRLISKHQDRFTLDACTPATQACLPATTARWPLTAASALPGCPMPLRRWPTARCCPTARAAPCAATWTGASPCRRFAVRPARSSSSTS